MKHVATRIAFLRERVKDKEIMLFHISAPGMIADIFTKPLILNLFIKFRSYILTKET